MTYLENNDLSKAELESFDCDAIFKVAKNIITPSVIEDDSGTQKLLHYTLIF